MTPNELVSHIERSKQHRFLYHFTDEANFPSIASRGLLSKVEMRRQDFWPKATGGNQLSWDLDAHRGIDKYVSLCMTTNHPMKYLAHNDGRMPKPKYLAIRPEVLKIDGVKIAFGVANANDVEILPLSKAIEKLDIEVLYSRTDWSDANIRERLIAAEKFEVLVPSRVPIEFIAGTM